MADGLDAIRSRDRHAAEYPYEQHTLHEGHDCGRCAAYDRRTLLAALDDCTASLDAAREREKALREAVGEYLSADAEMPEFADAQRMTPQEWDRRKRRWVEARRALAEPAGEQPQQAGEQP